MSKDFNKPQHSPNAWGKERKKLFEASIFCRFSSLYRHWKDAITSCNRLETALLYGKCVIFNCIPKDYSMNIFVRWTFLCNQGLFMFLEILETILKKAFPMIFFITTFSCVP